MRTVRLLIALALVVGLHTLTAPESWAQQGPPAVVPSGTQPATPADPGEPGGGATPAEPAVPGQFREADITPENVAKNPRLAEWAAKHPRR